MCHRSPTSAAMVCASYYKLNSFPITKIFLQLFWNMKTNLYTDEEGKNRDSGIADRLEYIMGKITESLSGSALEFYKREFDFFEKVTGISGEIK